MVLPPFRTTPLIFSGRGFKRARLSLYIFPLTWECILGRLFVTLPHQLKKEKPDGFLRDSDKVFFVEEGGEGSQEAFMSNRAAIKTSNCHKVEA